MTNTKLLDEAIQASGISKTFIAKKMGLSRQALYNKLSGKFEFRVSEINTLQNVLHLTPEQRESIFFALGSELNSREV